METVRVRTPISKGSVAVLNNGQDNVGRARFAIREREKTRDVVDGIPRLSVSYTRSKHKLVRRPHRHSHGGTGCGSARKPFLASRTAFFNSSRTASPSTYFR